jgi:diguanylate cyclase (GGDEF)-like protein
MRRASWDTAALVDLIGAVADVTADAAGVPDTLHRAVAVVCRHTPWMLGHVYLRDDTGSDRLVPTGPWHCDSDRQRFAGFCALVDAEPVQPGRGLCGRAVASGGPQWTADMARERGFSEAAATVGARHGLGAAVAVPVVVQGKVTAVLELFAGERFEPQPAFLSVAAAVAAILAGRLERELTDRRRLHDPLTGLANRALFAEEAVRSFDRCSRNGWTAGVLSLDLDGFRRVNDGLGHEVGDEVLVAIAHRVEAVLRQYDTVARALRVAARLGGDEFLLLCEDVPDPQAAAAIAGRVLGAVAAPLEVGGHGVAVTASVGSSDADAAVAEDERRLRRALEGGELRLVYQPKISLLTDRIVGVEALLRWEDPERGQVGPDEFIPLAEATGLIVPIGAYVLREAFSQAVAWLAAYPRPGPFTMAVNVSARQFRAGLLETVEAAVSETGLDKSFVDGLGTDAEATAVVAAVVSLAHALERDVVAEGVETTAQLDRLRSLGCDYAQGYLFARPAPASAIDALLADDAVGGQLLLERAGREADRHGAGETVLVADDAADMRQYVRMSLTAAGFTVEEARDGAEAVTLARSLRPDCIVLDVTMPDLNGLAVCATLRADPLTRDCIIIMLTSHDQAIDKVEAFAAGADDYMVKPFAPRDLVARVRTAILRRQTG